ncbi:MAG: T4SS efffector SepA family protein [Paracoccaceae bacterium]
MKTINISDESYAFLQDDAKAFVETEPAMVLSRLIGEVLSFRAEKAEPHPIDKKQKGPSTSVLLSKAPNLPDVSHTEVLDARINGAFIKNRSWQHALVAAVDAAIADGADVTEVVGRLSVKHLEGTTEMSGYYFSKAAGISLQGASANRILKQVYKLAEAYHLDIEIDWRWYGKPEAAYPGKSGKFVHP